MATIVISNGSGTTQAGLAGDALPKAVFPSAVAHPSHPSHQNESNRIEEEMRLNLKYPIEQGLITNWEDMIKLWQHTFKELNIDPTEETVLLTEPPCNPKVNREIMTQIMFEKFHTLGVFIANESVLSLFSSGHTTGLVIDSGSAVTYAVPTYEGHSLPHATGHSILGGRDVTDKLMELLSERGHHFGSPKEIDVLNYVKEQFAFIAIDYEQEMRTNRYNLDKDYQLPDGRVVTIGNERFRCTEILFQLEPSDHYCIQKMTQDSINKCDSDLHCELYNNIVLAGGNTFLTGFKERMQKEILSLAPQGTKVKVATPPQIKHSKWMGGSILASQPTFEQLCISKEEYDEFGPLIVHRKCF